MDFFRHLPYVVLIVLALTRSITTFKQRHAVKMSGHTFKDQQHNKNNTRETLRNPSIFHSWKLKNNIYIQTNRKSKNIITYCFHLIINL